MRKYHERQNKIPYEPFVIIFMQINVLWIGQSNREWARRSPKLAPPLLCWTKLIWTWSKKETDKKKQSSPWRRGRRKWLVVRKLFPESSLRVSQHALRLPTLGSCWHTARWERACTARNMMWIHVLGLRVLKLKKFCGYRQCSPLPKHTKLSRHCRLCLCSESNNTHFFGVQFVQGRHWYFSRRLNFRFHHFCPNLQGAGTLVLKTSAGGRDHMRKKRIYPHPLSHRTYSSTRSRFELRTFLIYILCCRHLYFSQATGYPSSREILLTNHSFSFWWLMIASPLGFKASHSSDNKRLGHLWQNH